MHDSPLTPSGAPSLVPPFCSEAAMVHLARENLEAGRGCADNKAQEGLLLLLWELKMSTARNGFIHT